MRLKRKGISIFLVIMMLFALALPQSIFAQTNENETIYLHVPHVGAESDKFQSESDCGGLTDRVVWHFILNQLDGDEGPLTLTVEFEKAGILTATGQPVGNGKVQHFYVGTPDHDKIVGAYVSGVEADAKLVLSHVCLENYENPEPILVVSIECYIDEMRSRWLITNPNAFPVYFDWVLLDDPEQFGNNVLAPPGESEIQTVFVMGAPNTIQITMGDKVVDVEDRFCYQELTLVSICSDDPETEYRWKIVNPNPYPVEVTWKILGSEELMGTVTVPANGEYVFGTTPTGADPEIGIISVNGRLQHKGEEGVIALGDICPTEPPVDEPPVDEPPTDNPPGDDTPPITIIDETPPPETIDITEIGVPALPSGDVLLQEVIEFEEQAPALPNTGGVSPVIYLLTGVFLVVLGTRLRREEV